MKIVHVVGARPNFMKVSPVWRALKSKTNFEQIVVHTGQHYAKNMSQVFFSELELPEPDHHLGVGSGTHAQQTAAIMVAFEKLVESIRPDIVLVYGDVNSTVAAGLVCGKSGIPFGHVEAGLRSFDRSMPEELNRLLTDQIADLLFTPSPDGDENLIREGIDPGKIHRVGNVMIDTLVQSFPNTRKPDLPGLSKKYALVTLHRPSNVDDLESLERIMTALIEISLSITIVFPVHPRTRRRIEEFDLTLPESDRLQLIDPLGYLEFIGLLKQATAVMTDSGGVQEETTYLGIPCLTLRENTERPVTVTVGTNSLVGRDVQKLMEEVSKILSGSPKKGKVPPLWDGRAGERIAGVLEKFGNKS
ncbi:MAG: non-hydrolyzing UDP-N-acetylglucosamine 2-epimerase [Fidelibacterota bacterium]